MKAADVKTVGYKFGQIVARAVIACIAACLIACMIALTVRFVFWLF